MRSKAGIVQHDIPVLVLFLLVYDTTITRMGPKTQRIAP